MKDWYSNSGTSKFNEEWLYSNATPAKVNPIPPWRLEVRVRNVFELTHTLEIRC